MTASHAQIHVHHYVSGWCSGLLHSRCKGTYAGTECSCSCHRKPGHDDAVADDGTGQ